MSLTSSCANSDEEKYENESFEKDSDIEQSVLSQSEDESIEEEFIPAINSAFAFKKYKESRGRQAFQNQRMSSYSSSDDEADVIISKTVAEINTSSMQFSDVASEKEEDNDNEHKTNLREKTIAVKEEKKQQRGQLKNGGGDADECHIKLDEPVTQVELSNKANKAKDHEVDLMLSNNLVQVKLTDRDVAAGKISRIPTPVERHEKRKEPIELREKRKENIKSTQQLYKEPVDLRQKRKENIKSPQQQCKELLENLEKRKKPAEFYERRKEHIMEHSAGSPESRKGSSIESSGKRKEGMQSYERRKESTPSQQKLMDRPMYMDKRKEPPKIVDSRLRNKLNDDYDLDQIIKKYDVKERGQNKLDPYSKKKNTLSAKPIIDRMPKKMNAGMRSSMNKPFSYNKNVYPGGDNQSKYSSEDEEGYFGRSGSSGCRSEYLDSDEDSHIDSRTSSGSFNAIAYAKYLESIQPKSSSTNTEKKGNRKSFSFSNDRMREIDRHNHILLRKILTQKPTYNYKPPKTALQKRFELLPPTTRLASATVNRKKQQRLIDRENRMLKQRIEAISLRKSLVKV